MKKYIIVTGVSGQVGSYMVDYLLANTDFDIVGVVRRTSKPDYSNLSEPQKNKRFSLEMADLSDSQSLDNLVKKYQPLYLINFAAQSFVGASWQIPEQTFDSCAMGVLRCLEAIRKHCITCRFYNAGSSEEFGDVVYSPQDMDHPFRAQSPYGAAKIAARQLIRVYRQSYKMYAIQGMLFNHESPRRGIEFVTRKITDGAAKIHKSIINHKPFEPIQLGNLDARRDWSHAKDFVVGIWMMLNRLEPKEYMLCSGETHTIREFIEETFNALNIKGSWMGDKYMIMQHGGFTRDSKAVVEVNPAFYRPADVELLCGNPKEAIEELGWKPQYSFKDLVNEMVESDVARYI